MIASLNAYKRRFSTVAAIGFTALALAACNTSILSQPEGGIGFREEDTPNFAGSYYSKTKSVVEDMLKELAR